MLNLIKEIAQANIVAVYQDAAQPSIRVLGKSLAQCISLFVSPIGNTAEIFEKNINRYIKKLDGLTEGELIPPDTRILVPILEKMRFIDEEKVADYYAQILATASKKDHAKKVMITFIEILNRLTADEIKILEYINSVNNKIPIIELTEEDVLQYGLSSEDKNLKEIILSSLPVIDIIIIRENTKGYFVFRENFNCLEEKINLNTPENISLYIDNMISLGLLERKHGTEFALRKIYDHLENHELIKFLLTNLKEGQKLEFERGFIKLTNLANHLLSFSSSTKK